MPSASLDDVSRGASAAMRIGLKSSACKHGTKASFGQDAGNGLSLVPLNFDATLLHRSSCSAGFLHRFGETFFFSLANADEICHDRHCFPAAVRGVANDIYTSTMLLGYGRCRFRLVGDRGCISRGCQFHILECGKRIRPGDWLTVRGNAFLLRRHVSSSMNIRSIRSRAQGVFRKKVRLDLTVGL